MIEFISRLPQGYQEVEYIESSGTQYVDTGYKPTSNNLRIACEFEYTADYSASSIFGSESSGRYSIVPWGAPEFYVGSSTQLLAQTTALNTKYVLDAHANAGTLTVSLNGTTNSASYSGSILTTVNIGIFCNIIAGVANQFCSMRLYAMSIYDNGELVRNFVPCYRSSDHMAGLYDLSNNVFYANAGSGIFAVGSNVGEIVITSGGVIPFAAALRRRMMMRQASLLPSGYTQVDYIQGTGSQYIDTGFLVNKSDNYTLEIDAQFNASSSKAFQGANSYMQMYITAKYGIRSDGVSVGNRDLIVIGYANNIETLTINGVVQETHDWTTEYSGADEKLGVFRMGNINNSWFSGTIATGKLYGYKVWKDGILVSECIPCLRNSDSAVGLYDIVLKQFVENAGTGVFGYYITPVLPFGLKYTGDFSVETVDGAKIVTLLSSGTLTVTRSITAEVYMLAGGGGAAFVYGYWTTACTGGGGGYDTFTTELNSGDYPITIGAGGAAANSASAQSGVILTGGTGGDTIAFGRTCTGGTGSTAGASASVGNGGSPNGENGRRKTVSGTNPMTVLGGAPNGGKLEVIRGASQQAYSGGDGYITLTIPI